MRKGNKRYFEILIYAACLFLLTLIICIFIPDYSISGRDNLCITEICCKNEKMVHDENGVYGYDYIEVYNPSSIKRSLAGCSISDKSWGRNRFLFPDVVIEPKSFVIVWCGEDKIASYGQRPEYVPKDFHNTEFSLKLGETCTLWSRRGRVLSQIELTDIPVGKVLASTKDGIHSYHISDPTPGYIDETYIQPDSGGYRPDKPRFSVEAGCYDKPFYLELECSEGEIHYTVDGTEPDEDSPVYSGPVYVYDRSGEENIFAGINGISQLNDYVPKTPVDKCFVVKAVAVKDGKAGDVACRTYIVGLSDDPAYKDISIMSVTTDPDNLFDPQNGIYTAGSVYENFRKKTAYEEIDTFGSLTNYFCRGRGWERPAHIEYFDQDHRLWLEQDVGIRIHGGWSSEYNQKSFNLYAREEYGNGKFGTDLLGFETSKVLLRSGGFRDVYYTKLRDVFNQKLVEDRAMGIQRAKPCAVFLNGEYWGLYNLQEAIDASYVKAHYGINEEDLILLKNSKVTVGNPEDLKLYKDLVEYAVTNDLSVEENYKKIEEMMDIQSYIDYQCFELYVVNSDSVNNNFCRFRSRTVGGEGYRDGRWRWILYDTDDSAAMVEGLTEASVDSFNEGHWGKNPMEDKLFAALLENEGYRQRFIDTFTDMIKTDYSYERVSEELNKMAALYRSGVVKSQQRFRGGYVPAQGVDDLKDGMYTEEVFDEEIRVIDDFYRQRPEYMLEYIEKNLGPGDD